MDKIEHRLFSFITMNWRGKPLASLETIVNLIAGTTTSTGLEVYAQLGQGTYPAKISVSDADYNVINLRGHDFHPRLPPRVELLHQAASLTTVANTQTIYTAPKPGRYRPSDTLLAFLEAL